MPHRFHRTLATILLLVASCTAPPPATPATCTYLAGELPADVIAAAERAAPGLRIVAGLTADQAIAMADQADGVDGRLVDAEFFAKATKLRWVQAMSAGVDRYLALPGIVGEQRIVLTNLRGAHGPCIADHVFAMLLALTRDLRHRFEQQAAARWDAEGSGVTPLALQGSTMLVVGFGGIGSEVAQRAHGFGMRVIATRRTDAPAPQWIARMGKPDELLAMLPEADVVVVCVPLTKETERLFDAKAFAAMKRGAFFVNIGRGKIVDTEALVAALRDQRLAGACLDVTEPEPLPQDSPLWAMRNVVITPHVASRAELTRTRSQEMLVENLRRFAAGEELRNVVDKQAGY